MKLKRVLLLVCFLVPTLSYAKTFTIFHTNDEHSRLLGFAPDYEYNPAITGDGTVGGAARLSTLLNQKRATAQTKGPMLTLEAGDFSMGTLFQLISREKGVELQLFKLLQYDAISLGNHEFDFGVKGLSQMIESALREVGSLPPIVASNLVLTSNDPRDEKLRQFVKQGVIKPYVVLERGGLRFGILGLIGYEATEVTTNKAPVQFADPIQTAKHMADLLRKQEKVDVVIALSHSGVARNDPNWLGTELLTVGDDGKWIGEDINLAKAVPDIDVIISGHSHTPLNTPIIIGKTVIVQAGAEMRYLGELELDSKEQKVHVTHYNLNPINDQILGDAAITQKVEEFKKYINETKLLSFNASFEKAAAKIDHTVTRVYTDNAIGHLLATAFQSAAQADIGFCPDGIIRDDIFHGKSGIQSFSDIFRLSPLGIGEIDEESGYPIIKVSVNGKELKQIIEVLLLAYKVKGSNYHPRFSGMEIDYNPYRIPLDRVIEARLKKTDGRTETIDFNDEKRLYSIGTTSYVGKFFWVIPEVSMGLFSVTPKFADGRPIIDLKDSLVNGEPGATTLHEYKSWRAIFDYLQKLPKEASSGLPIIPTDGDVVRSPLNPMPNLAPSHLFKNATWIQWTGMSALSVVLVIFASLGLSLARRRQRKKVTFIG